MKKLVIIVAVLFLVPACFGGLMQKCASKKISIAAHKKGVFNATVDVENSCRK